MTKQIRSPGRPPIYDWPKWTNGRIWTVRRNEPNGFTCQPASFEALLRIRAQKLGKRVRVQVDGLTVTFQFREAEQAATA